MARYRIESFDGEHLKASGYRVVSNTGDVIRYFVVNISIAEDYAEAESQAKAFCREINEDENA